MTSTTSDRIFRLASGPNNYDWGPLGRNSLVAQFAPNAAKPGYKVEVEEPYSELWMGTHPTNPSFLYPSGPLLSAHLKAHPDLLGDATKFPPPFTASGSEEKDGGHVPFLFKILCARKALPLQIHPDKDLAAQLHEQDPESYPDTNHKPEIAVCLSDRFLGFANFRPIAQTQAILSTISELSSTPLRSSNGFMSDLFDMAISGEQGTDLPENDVAKLKAAWKAFLLPEVVKSEQVKRAVSAWAARVADMGVKVFDGAKGEGVLDGRDKENIVEAVGLCERYYPGDPATLACIVFMNLVELKKGQGMYVGADGLHAWLSGDIVELMATSDNVLNIGFTSPSEIAESLPIVSRAVSAQPASASSIILSHSTFTKSANGNITAYSVPFEEFSIMRVSGSDRLKALSGPAIGIVTQGRGVRVEEQGKGGGGDGSGLDLDEGMVFFLGAGTDACFELPDGAEAWLAFYDGDKEARGQVGEQ